MAEFIEFWQQNGQIYVEHNSKQYTFHDFLKITESRMIIESMYNKILNEYSSEVGDKKNKGEIVGSFIKNHFLKRDKVFDVIIYNQGKIVKFNVEE